MNSSPTTNPIRSIACSALLLPNGQLAHNALLTFDSEGTLITLQTDVQNLDRRSSTEYYNGVLIPSMTNTHNHLELSYFNGVIPQGTGLVDFVRHVITHRNDVDVPQRIEHLQKQDRIMWAQGTGAVGDISNDPFSLATKANSPIYYHTFAEYFGMPSQEQADTYYHSCVDPVVNEGQKQDVTVTPSPHSTYLMSDRLLKLGATTPRASIHFMETPSEMGIYQKQGGMYEFILEGGMTPDFLHYGSHPERLVQSLPTNLPMLLVHCAQMKKADIEKVMENFNDVTFVLCPRSNYYIERGFPPADLFYQMGARVALGTDSLCSNTSLSLISEVEWLSKNNPQIPMATILSWATTGGASALGISDKMGSFTVGTKCGAVLVEGLSPADLHVTQTLTSRRLI